MLGSPCGLWSSAMPAHLRPAPGAGAGKAVGLADMPAASSQHLLCQVVKVGIVEPSSATSGNPPRGLQE